VGGDPGFGGGVGLGMQAPGGVPEVFQDVDEIDQPGRMMMLAPSADSTSTSVAAAPGAGRALA